MGRGRKRHHRHRTKKQHQKGGQRVQQNNAPDGICSAPGCMVEGPRCQYSQCPEHCRQNHHKWHEPFVVNKEYTPTPATLVGETAEM